jgi:F-type H+-transporting ATPase subunit b
MQVVSNIALISINATLVIQGISFLILMFVLNRIMFKPLRRSMRERERHIQKIRDAIAGADAEARDVSKTIHAKENTVREEAFALNSSIMAEGDHEAEKIFEAAQAEIGKEKKKAEALVKAQVEAARQHLEAESRALADRIMEKLLDRRLAT